ncbi:MAG: hypothetical protein H0V76_12645, partial [Blastocatellia bacterium]|nr:hypothetical protein [Blastocatellia bacterium]
MSAAQETIKSGRVEPAGLKYYSERAVRFLSSVRFGISMLILLVVLSMIGMLIIQQNVNGF